ncbi:MAG: ABC transporter permease [Streptosporangiaceae bacterium]
MEDIIYSGLLLTTPILLAALGGAINWSAGIVNIGLDGMMLIGAFVGVFVDWQTGSVLVGCIAAVVAGAITGWLFALPITRLGANQIMAGLGLAILVPGFFGYILPIAFGQASTLQPGNIHGVPSWPVPLLSKIPAIGFPIFTQDPITYLSWLAIPATWLVMRRTPLGIRLRACGDNEVVALGAGLPVKRLQELSTVIAGALSALGGAQLALVSVQLFNKDMTAGRGFLALAAFYFGRGRPGMTAVAAFIFGLSDAVALRLQTQGFPDQLPEMIPYIVVILALIVVAVRDRVVKARALRSPGSPPSEVASAPPTPGPAPVRT